MAKAQALPDLGPATEIIDEMGTVADCDLIPLLQKIQDAYGYLPQDVMTAVSEKTGLPASRIYGVATFYEQFHLKPRGRHLVRCCRGTACHVRRGKSLIDALQRELGVSEGGTTEDNRFTFETVACLGTCFLAPVITVDKDYYGQVSTANISSILKKYK